MKVFSEKLQNEYQDETEARPKNQILQWEEVRNNMTGRAIEKMTVDFLLGDKRESVTYEHQPQWQ